MTKQEIYDKVKNHLLTQNKKSAKAAKFGEEDSFQCQYRHEGLKCAIGCLIPDELYKPEMESKLVCTLRREFSCNFLLPSDEKEGGDFLRGLQYIHDDYEPKEWKLRLNLFSKEWNLIP